MHQNFLQLLGSIYQTLGSLTLVQKFVLQKDIYFLKVVIGLWKVKEYENWKNTGIICLPALLGLIAINFQKSENMIWILNWQNFTQ